MISSTIGKMPSVGDMPSIDYNIAPKKNKNIDNYKDFIPLDILNSSLNDEGAVKVSLLTKNLAKKDTPPLYNQIFNEPKIDKDGMNDIDMDNPPKGKFSSKEVQNLTKIYGSKSVEKSYDEQGYIDKGKFRSFLAKDNFPPMQIESKQNEKDLLNINV